MDRGRTIHKPKRKAPGNWGRQRKGKSLDGGAKKGISATREVGKEVELEPHRNDRGKYSQEHWSTRYQTDTAKGFGTGELSHFEGMSIASLTKTRPVSETCAINWCGGGCAKQTKTRKQKKFALV